ncbi:MAG TPA: hypothetical protein VKA48_05220, partial [Gammaproteobacteria bacterium]|nr:hypothetical protein [Gammaproteobacteria bacterium]
MRQTSWNEEEDEAMQGLPIEAQVLYLRGLRQHMDYESGVVGGPQRRISWRSLRDVLYVEPHQGIAGGSPDRAKVRRLVQWLEKAGLVARMESQDHLVFRLPLATRATSAQKKADPKPTPSRPPQTQPESRPTPDSEESPEQWGFESDGVEKADPEADPKPTPQESQKADPHQGSGNPGTTTTPHHRAPAREIEHVPASPQEWQELFVNEFGYSFG